MSAIDRADEVREMYGEDDPQSMLLSSLISAADLDRMTFPPLSEHVPSLITEGFGVLAGSPKAGKSWMVAGIALACAHGGIALGGIPVRPRAVLLMALEDGHRRLQSRMRHLAPDRPLPARLDILTEIAPGFTTVAMNMWLERHADDANPPLVILDTLGRARPQRRPGDDPYIADYQLGSKLKATIDAIPGAALLAVHHTRKMAADDWLDTISGTQGIAGSVDYALVLNRKRKSDEGVLAVTGRDIAENEYALTVTDGAWSLDGADIRAAANNVAARAERDVENKLGNTSLDALKYVLSRESTTPKQLADHLGIDNQRASKILGRLVDSEHIDRYGRGDYGPSGGKSGKSGKSAGSPSSAVFPLFPHCPPTHPEPQ